MKMSEMMTRWCRFELSESDSWTIQEMNLPFMRSKIIITALSEDAP